MDKGLANYGTEIVPKIIDFFENLLQVQYPLPKSGMKNLYTLQMIAGVISISFIFLHDADGEIAIEYHHPAPRLIIITVNHVSPK